MINLLIAGVADDFFRYRTVETIMKQEAISNCFMIVHKKRDLEMYSKLGECFLREDIAQGNLKYWDISSDEPLDDNILAYMEPFLIEILTQQRRFEEYHEFQIPFSYENHYEILMNNLKFWYGMLKIKKITHFFLTSVPHEGYDSIIYHLCKYLGIKVGMIYNATIPRRYYYLEDYTINDKYLECEYDKLTEKYKDSTVEQIHFEEDIEKIYGKWASLEPDKMRPYYAKGNPLFKRYHIRFGMTNIFETWKMILGPHYKEFDYKPSMRFVMSEIRNIGEYFRAIPETYKRYLVGKPVWRRTLELNRYYDKLAVHPDLKQKYIYFALHYQPEASSNPLGGREFADQRIAIALLAASVPEGYYIYVKSHPEQLAPLRSKAFYDEIAHMNRVRLVSMDTDTYALMKSAVAVSSLTGTAGWEAQFYGIPAILFGYSQKNTAPLTYHVRTIDECRQAVQDIITAPKKDVRKELKLLIKAIYDTSFSDEKMDEKLPEIVKRFLA